MVEFEYEEMMNRSVDGELSPDEQAKLEKYLKAHPEAVRYYENVKRTKAVLKRVSQVDPPAQMTQNIMAEVRSGRRTKAEKQSILDFVRDRFRRKTAWKYAYSFVAGALCGIIILVVSLNLPETQRTIDPAHVSGTILTPQWSESIPVSDERSFVLGKTEVFLATKVTKNHVILDVDIVGSDELNMALSYDSDDLMFAGLLEPDGFSGELEFQEGLVTLKQHSGGSYIILYNNIIRNTSKLIIEVANGTVSHTEEMVLTPVHK